MAREVGVEPTTIRLTVERSATELLPTTAAHAAKRILAAGQSECKTRHMAWQYDSAGYPSRNAPSLRKRSPRCVSNSSALSSVNSLRCRETASPRNPALAAGSR